MNEYLTWEFLGTFSGMVGAVTLLVQFLKLPFDKVWKIPTRYIVLFISMALLFAVEIFTTGFDPQRIPLVVLNAVVVSVASLGTYEVTIQKIETRIKNQ